MKLWNLKAGWYDGSRRIGAVRWILDEEKRNLRSLLSAISDFPQTVVDAGTGAGSTLDIFPASVRIVGMDRSIAMLRHTEKNRPITGIVGDIRNLPFRAMGIPFLSVIGVLEYVPDYRAFLEEVRQAVAENGYFLVTISPPGTLNRLRNLLGHPLYPIGIDEWESAMKRFPFVCLQRRKSLFQLQFLYRKTKQEVRHAQDNTVDRVVLGRRIHGAYGI
jgi:SAM-dependent methyltransferase